MSSVITTGRSVAKRKNNEPQTPAGEPAFDRVEFQAPPEWVKELDEIAASLGLSRSAFIRMACNKIMQAEQRQKGGE